MKKFNLLKEIIVIARDDLHKAINTNQEFAINHQGYVLTPPYAKSEVLVFKGTAEAPKASALAIPKPQTIAQILGSNYKVVEDEGRVLIKAGGNWQELIAINTPNSEYDDTTADGIAEFATKEMENIGWHGDEFNIDYRDMVDELESKVEGIILCVEQEEPYQFSGLGMIHDIEEAKKVHFDFCQALVKEKLANDPDFAADNLTDDEEEAAKFFKAL
ncbi:MAG: hypothetical protein ABFR02_02495 [Campylobacterota bacterium]